MSVRKPFLFNVHKLTQQNEKIGFNRQELSNYLDQIFQVLMFSFSLQIFYRLVQIRIKGNMQRTTVKVVKYKINQNNVCQFCTLYQQRLQQSQQQIERLNQFLMVDRNNNQAKTEAFGLNSESDQEFITAIVQKYDTLLLQVEKLAQQNINILKQNERKTEENLKLYKQLSDKAMEFQNFKQFVQREQKERSLKIFNTQTTIQQKISPENLRWENSTKAESERKGSSTSRTETNQICSRFQTQMHKIQKLRHGKIEKLAKILSEL